MSAVAGYGIDLYWLPLGAGGHSVRLNGRVYEALLARFERRHPLDLYHSALVVHAAAGRFVIEVTPVTSGDGTARGAVAEGAVGSRFARRLRIFRYEVRRWKDGTIPDASAAVGSPRRLSDEAIVCDRLLRLVPLVPTLVWGRDESSTGDMWNSNSVISWLLTQSGAPVDAARPPEGGRAPGWHAGIVVARRRPLSSDAAGTERAVPQGSKPGQ